jgi:hypothetical protein
MATDLSALDVVVSLLTSGASVVIGSRALTSSDVEDRHSGFRRAGAAVFRALARTVVPDCTDTQCGFKFFAGPIARAAALALKTAGFAFDIELIAHCQRLGATLTEIPVSWRDVPGSTFSVARHSAVTSWDVATTWLRLRLDADTEATDSLATDTMATDTQAGEPQPGPGAVAASTAGLADDLSGLAEPLVGLHAVPAGGRTG